MKIKEVIEKTGLTDRAIRLYISSGLIHPVCQKSYTGRNNFEFSNTDITQLQHIALLRKAGFSLDQIGALQKGGSEAAAAFRAYMDARKEEYETGEKVLRALGDFSLEETPTIEELCRCLAVEFREQSAPGEELSFRERILNLIGWSLWGLTVAEYVFAVLSVSLETLRRFPFCQISMNAANVPAILVLLVPGVLLVWALVLRGQWRSKQTVLLTVALLIRILLVPIAVALIHVVPPVYSQTENPDHYLEIGDDVRGFMDDIYSIFPAKIPDEAKVQQAIRFDPAIYADSTHYFYRYEYSFSPDLDIFAQWNLSQDAIAQERGRIMQLGAQYNFQRVTKGNWECFVLSVEENPLQTEDCTFELIFACNEKTGSVRYIVYLSVSHDKAYRREAYYESVDW